MVPAFNIHVKAFLFVKTLFQGTLYLLEMQNLDFLASGFHRHLNLFQEKRIAPPKETPIDPGS
jgi:hypothetical protein